MKTLIKTTAVLLLFITSSCMFTGVKGNGNVVTEDRTIDEDFSGISASTGIDVYLTMANSVSLTLEADENLHDIIVTEVEDGILKIYAEENIWSAKRRKIYVSAKDINLLRTTSGAEIISKNTIKSEDLKVSSTSGSHVKLTVDVTNLKCSTTSGANARLSGSADSFIAKSTSGANIKASELEARKCDASVTSGADIYINVIEELDANATSGGDIKYKGNPEKIRKNSSSGGGIRG